MQPQDVRHHIVTSYDVELTHLRGTVVAMATTVVRQIQEAVDALIASDSALARQVVKRELEVDTLSLAADEEVFRVIARRQPTAVDLRLVLAIARIVGDLERAGDKAERIAKQTLRLTETESGPLLPESALTPMRRLVEIDCQLLLDAVAGLTETDLDKANAVFQAEAQLSAASAALRDALVGPAVGLTGAHFASLLIVAHALERAGNHANNIAEQVVYVITGEDVRFRNRELLIDRLRHRSPD